MKGSEIRTMLWQQEIARKKYIRPYLVKMGLTVGQGQPRILKNLLVYGPQTQRELADRCLLDVSTMSRSLDRMEAASRSPSARPCRPLPRIWRRPARENRNSRPGTLKGASVKGGTCQKGCPPETAPVKSKTHKNGTPPFRKNEGAPCLTPVLPVFNPVVSDNLLHPL